MSFYNIDFATLCRQLLPVRLRKVRHIAWLRSLIQPVFTLHASFMNNMGNNNYYIAHNSQVCYMEAVLNDRFDPSSQRFEIHDGPICDPVYVYLASETRRVHIATEAELPLAPSTYDAPVYLYTAAEAYDVGVVFRVYCPEDFDVLDADNINELKALINKYRLVSRVNFEILEGPAPPLVV